MAVQMQPNYILQEKFEKLKFGDYNVSTDSMSTPSTPSTPNSPSIEPYDIEIIKEEDREDALQFLRRFFIQDEPLNVAINLLENPDDRCVELEEFSMKDIGSGLNLKAVANGRIIGVCLNGILNRGYLEEDDEEIYCPNKKFEKILRLLSYIGKESDIFAHYPEDEKAMTVKILSVDGSFRGRGIAKDLMNRTREIAREHGCTIMTVDCSSHFTARALKKLGFGCIYTLKYEDYKVDGEVVFKPEAPHTAATVYTQRIAQIFKSSM